MAEELLTNIDSVALVAAAIKLLTKQPDVTPVRITEEMPNFRRRRSTPPQKPRHPKKKFTERRNAKDEKREHWERSAKMEKKKHSSAFKPISRSKIHEKSPCGFIINHKGIFYKRNGGYLNSRESELRIFRFMSRYASV